MTPAPARYYDGGMPIGQYDRQQYFLSRAQDAMLLARTLEAAAHLIEESPNPDRGAAAMLRMRASDKVAAALIWGHLARRVQAMTG